MSSVDQQILSNLREDGERAMKLLYDNFYSKLCYTAIRYVKEDVIAEDLVQDLFLDIWKKRNTFEINSTLGGYLQRSIVNRSLNWLRSNKVQIDDIEDYQSTPYDANDSHQTLEGEELEDHINKVIDSLPEKCRLVFVMSRFDQLSYKEIGEKLGISVKTVENQISKALKILRAELANFSKY